MFETAFVRERSVRPWAMPASVVLQTGIVGTLLLVPMVFFDALPPLALAAREYLPLSAPPRLGEPRASSGGVAVSRRAPAIPFTAPRNVPSQVVMLDDAPGPPTLGPQTGERAGGLGVLEGVVGGMELALVRPAPPPSTPRGIAEQLKPQPKPPDRVRVGGVVRPPVLLRDVKPVYPPLARAARISGPVRLDAIIGRDGRIQSLRVLGGHPMLSAAALEAVREWVYQPTLLNGEPVEVILQIDVNFTLSTH